MRFYKWENREDFQAWHSEVKNALGIPHLNVNGKTGEIDENSTWTMEYTSLKTDDNNVLYAYVEPEIAEQFSEGLGEPHEPYYDIEEII